MTGFGFEVGFEVDFDLVMELERLDIFIRILIKTIFQIILSDENH